MKQTIKSLSEQMKKVCIDEFVVEEYKSGDYGYNVVYGLLHNKIKVGFKVAYQKDTDDVSNIENIINKQIEWVDYISSKLSPENCSLISYINGENLTSFELYYNIDGKIVNFMVPLCYWKKNHPTSMPPIYYSNKELVKVTKKTILSYTKNFKVLLEDKSFDLEKYELSNGERVLVRGKQKYIPSVIISGKAYGVCNTFVIQDFENANVKKILKKELEKIRNPLFANKSNSKKTIDLRKYTKLVNAYNQSNLLKQKYISVYDKYEKLKINSNCNECKNYDPNNDVTFWRYEGILDQNIRFSNCSNKCDKIENVKKAFSTMMKRKQAMEEYNKTEFIPMAFELFDEYQPNFVNWLIGETVSWKELFPDVSSTSVDELYLLLDSGSTGRYVWENNIITISGQTVKEERKELLELGQDTAHNIRNVYMPIRDNDIILENNKISYNHNKDGDIKIKNDNRYNAKINTINEGIKRLKSNYDIFETDQDKYMVNSMLAIYLEFLEDHENAKYYKQQAISLSESNVVKDEKIETLFKGIVD